MTARDYLQRNRNESLEEWKELLRIPSISSQEKYRPDMRRCAEWAVRFLEKTGLQSELLEPGGHPIVYGEYSHPDNRITALIYGHYDVQPVDPLELWQAPPFEPEERDGYIWARGASDDKGQFFAHFKAAEAWLRNSGKLPVNVKFLIEGEEECGTSFLHEFVGKNRERFKADVAVISDGAQYGPGMPALTIGLRGIAAAEVKVTGSGQDLHSGIFGGAVANPVHILAKIIAGLHGPGERVNVEGFYDRVYPPGDWERKQLSRLRFDREEFRAETGAPALKGEEGYSPLEWIWSRPTLDVNGITGGYQGEGIKTIIPSWASAKITMRLVPEMDPEEIFRLLEKHLHRVCPPEAILEIKSLGGGKPYRVAPESPWLKAGTEALREGFATEPFFIKEGGSVPVVELFQSALGLDTLLLGFGQRTDNAHSPNERFAIEDFHRGCLTAAALLPRLAGAAD